MKAAIPVPYIIALILGIVVVAVLGYWLIFSGGRGGGVVASSECKARMLAFCLEQQTGLGEWGAKDQQVCNKPTAPTEEECSKFVKKD